jgi:hypothetical protein
MTMKYTGVSSGSVMAYQSHQPNLFEAAAPAPATGMMLLWVELLPCGLLMQKAQQYVYVVEVNINSQNFKLTECIVNCKIGLSDQK